MDRVGSDSRLGEWGQAGVAGKIEPGCGEIPSAADPPSGCVFHTRCPRKLGEICETQEPPLAEVEPEHFMRCHIPIEELRALQQTQPKERAPAS